MYVCTYVCIRLDLLKAEAPNKCLNVGSSSPPDPQVAKIKEDISQSVCLHIFFADHHGGLIHAGTSRGKPPPISRRDVVTVTANKEIEGGRNNSLLALSITACMAAGLIFTGRSKCSFRAQQTVLTYSLRRGAVLFCCSVVMMRAPPPSYPPSAPYTSFLCDDYRQWCFCVLIPIILGPNADRKIYLRQLFGLCFSFSLCEPAYSKILCGQGIVIAIAPEIWRRRPCIYPKFWTKSKKITRL